jgi:DNA-binding transcriptional MerR regulator
MNPLETFSVTQAGKMIGKAPNTLRTWSRPDYFGPYLSEYANPGPGAERRYTEDDLRILRTAVILQRRGLQISDIIPRIASGEILEELPGEETIGAQEGREESPGRALAPLSLSSQLELFLRPYETQISRLTADLDREREELERERAARIEAEKELSRLSAKLEERDKPWYKRLFGD